jgi:peptidoglycan/xylan/chitin deacetylase (PgdA/CDA1 family)/protein involved in polysaccharide export with SLBB domain
MIKGKRAFLAKLLFRSKAYRYLRMLESKNLVIFNYHRIRSNDEFECAFDEGVYGPTESELREQLSWLKANTNIISEQELIDHVHHQRELPESSTMITFDDGYRDNADLALPILKDLKIPAIFFISTEAIENRGLGWWDNIAYLIKHTERARIWIRGHEFSLLRNKEQVIHELQEWMRTHRTIETLSLVEELAESCGVKLPEASVSSRELMSWEQIEEARASGITIGSHTHTHRVLSTLSKNEQIEEFLVSKQILETKLKTRVRSIAYPVGGHDDCHMETGGLAEQCGYELGFSFQTGFNQLDSIHPFCVRRISSEEGIPLTCAAVSLPSVFSRSRTGERSTRTLFNFSAKINDKDPVMNLKTDRPNVMRQTSLLMIILSLVLGPVASSRAYAAAGSDEAVESSAPTGVADDTDDTNTSTSNTVIAPGFKIRITCPTDSKINGSFRVGADGDVSLPYDVTVHAAGVKTKALAHQLEKTYKQYFKEEPKITVVVAQKRYSVKITGVVKSPGTYLLKEHTTLDEALAMAQVRTEDVGNGYIRIGSGKSSKWVSMADYMKGGPAHDLAAWRGGEQLLFQMDRPESDSKDAADEIASSPSARQIQVLGEVRNPGPVSFQHHADGYYYLIQRGGPTQFSDLSQVEVVRKDPQSNEHKSISVGDLKNVKDIRESDVIIVHPDRPNAFDHTLQNVGIVASILSAVVLTVFVVRNK